MSRPGGVIADDDSLNYLKINMKEINTSNKYCRESKHSIKNILTRNMRSS
jgi:hypothetical protein